MEAKEKQLVQSVERALAILSAFSVENQLLSIAELAEKLALPKSTISRLLTTLKAYNFIEQELYSQRYCLGFRVYELGNVYAAGIDLRKLAYAGMKELNQKTSETVTLNVLERGERVCIDKIESPHQIRSFVKVGLRSSLCFGASGKVLLAFLPDAEIKYLIEKENLTVNQELSLRNDLKKIKERGFAMTVGDRIEGLLSIAAPIYDSAGLVIAGVSVSGPAERLKPKADSVIKNLLETTKMISLKMGFNKNVQQNAGLGEQLNL